jgi:hypothetical protein
MIMLVIILIKLLGYVTNKARISDGGSHVQLTQRVRNEW